MPIQAFAQKVCYNMSCGLVSEDAIGNNLRNHFGSKVEESFPTSSSTMAKKNKNKKKKAEAASCLPSLAEPNVTDGAMWGDGTTDGTAEKTEAESAAGTTDGASFKRAAWADLPIEVPSTDLVLPTGPPSSHKQADIRNLIAELEASRDAVACGRWTMEDKCLLLSTMTRERAALMCRTLGMSGKGSRKQLIDRLAGSTFSQGWY